MQSLLMSKVRRQVSPAKLTNLSPEKYGKAAWADLTYTPSKLADNVMYRQVTTLRKVEEGSSKIRQFQAFNGFMKERLSQLQQERDGIEKSLSQQIVMYKKMLHDAQTNHEQRLKDIQKRFSAEISTLIQQKQEQAKYSQAEKELLQNKIQELEIQLKNQQQRQTDLEEEHSQLNHDYEKLSQQYKNTLDKLRQTETQKLIAEQQSRRKQHQSQKKHLQLQSSYKQRLQNLNNQKIRQKQNLQRLMKTQLQKAENIRMNQSLRKSQQVREIMQSFEGETKRLNQIIAMKQRMVEALTLDSTKAKQSLLQVTKSYESRTHSLANQRNNFAEDCERLTSQVSSLSKQLQNQVISFAAERDRLGGVIVQLREDLQVIERGNAIEREKFQYWGADLETQAAILRNENFRMKDLAEENSRLNGQLRNLRDLLRQSSFQIEQSKEQFRRIVFQRDSLQLRLQKSMQQSQKIFRMRRQSQQQALRWRNLSYTQRSAYR